MFRDLFLFSIFAVLALVCGAQTQTLPSSNTTVTGDSAPVDPVTPLTTEKKQLEKEVCDTSKGQDLRARVLDTDKGPQKVVVTEKKVEEFPDNVTKEVTVTKKAEKGPSNETQEHTVVERKTVQDIDSDSDNAKKNVTIEIETESKVCDNKTEQVTKPNVEPVDSNQTIDDLEAEVERLQHGAEKVKRELKEQEAKTGKVEPANETVTVESETVAPVNETEKADNKTVLSVNETAVSVNETEKADNKTALPVNQTVVSVNETEKAENKTALPVNETVVLVNETEKVENKTAVPANETVVHVNETGKAGNKTKEQISCAQCYEELKFAKFTNKKLLDAVIKLLKNMTHEKRDTTVRMIAGKEADRILNHTHPEETAVNILKEAKEKPIVVKETTKA